MSPRTLALTAVALVAFAANSWLCRAALRSGAIDAASFTAVRLASGAFVLCALAALARPASGARKLDGSASSAAALFVYALGFSLAYLALDAGLGALLLFGAVQLTMLAGGLADGHRVGGAEAAGILLAATGLVVLAAPGRGGADPLAAFGMVVAGVAWGIYSLRGRGAGRPIAVNAGNFLAATPAALGALALAAWVGAVSASSIGLLFAVVSGAVTSGLGYAVWYRALPGLRPSQAGLVQLAVPVLAAAGGVALLGERIHARLVVAALLVLGGIALALRAPAPDAGPTR